MSCRTADPNTRLRAAVSFLPTSMVSFGYSVLPFTLIILSLHFSLLRAQDDVTCLQEMKQSIVDPRSYMSNWKFGGSTPVDICSFTGVTCWQGQGNKVYSVKLVGQSLSGNFPGGLSKCTSIEELDLSDNDFDGNLPSDLSVQLQSLKSLDLSTNKFSGSIPEDLASCTNLNKVWLQHNQLGDVIPWQLGFLPQLTDLNLSYNNLSGQIPSTFTQRQFVSQSAFPASAFEGNPGLCGPPLATTCTAF